MDNIICFNNLCINMKRIKYIHCDDNECVIRYSGDRNRTRNCKTVLKTEYPKEFESLIKYIKYKNKNKTKNYANY